MMKLTWAVLLVLLVGCASTPEETRTAEREDLASETRDEVKFGREMAAKLYGHFGKYEGDHKLADYVSLVGANLAERFGRPELAFRFGILGTDEVNAFATPGGFIFITDGLLRQVQSEAELAAILAHEIAHVNEKHMYLGIMPKKDVGATESVARIMSRGHADLGKSMAVLADKGLQMLIEGGLGKEKEQEADQQALLTVASLGYDGQALLVFLRRLQAAGDKLKLGKVAQPFAERVSALETFAKENGITNRSTADAGVLQKRFARAWGTLDQ